jgi:hypothetical protein
MKEPLRLSDEQPDGFEAELIRAGRRDAPSPTVRRASALASGIAVASALAPKTSVAASVLTTILAAGAKGMLIGTLVTGTIVGVPHLMSARGNATVSARATATSGRQAAPHDARPSVAATSPPEMTPPSYDSTPAATEAPRENVLATAPPQSHPRRVYDAPISTTQVAKTSTRLADEVRAFERARGAFTRGDVATASSELASYERAFSRGALSLEAQVLRIEILKARGEQTEARARARAFLEANPSAPAARHVRNLLTQSGSETFR